MKIALNYSPQAARLLDEGAIALDYYKCPDWPDMVATASQQRPVYVHFPLMAGRHNHDQVGWEKIDSLLAVTGTPYINTHLAPRASDFAGLTLDTTDSDYDRQLRDAMMDDVQVMIERFGAERVILENATWDPSYEIPGLVLKAERISQIVHDTGAGFLLDVAHARCSAAYLGLDPRDYMNQLPVDRLKELHVTGVIYDTSQNRLNDHFPMTDVDWELTEWALGQIHSGAWAAPWAVALEYGGVGPGFGWRSHAEVIAVEVPRLTALVNPVHVQ